MFAITCFTCFLELSLVKARIVDDGPVAYCLTVSYTSGMTLHGTESDKFNVPVPVVDVGDSSLRVPSLLSDEPTLELSGILSTNSVMIPVVHYLCLKMYLLLAKV